VTRVRDAERELDRTRSAQLLGAAEELTRGAEDIGGAGLVGHRGAEGPPPPGGRGAGRGLRGRGGRAGRGGVGVGGSAVAPAAWGGDGRRHPGRPAGGGGRGQRTCPRAWPERGVTGA